MVHSHTNFHDRSRNEEESHKKGQFRRSVQEQRQRRHQAESSTNFDLMKASNGFSITSNPYKQTKSVNSRYLNFPIYSFKGKTITYKQVISKNHIVDATGIETPGVGQYSPPPYEFTNSKAPQFSVGSQERFLELKQQRELKSRIPCLYGTYNLFGKKRTSFTRAERFRQRSPLEEKEINQPGPAEYKVEKYHSIAPEKVDLLGQSTSNKEMNRTMYKFDR